MIPLQNVPPELMRVQQRIATKTILLLMIAQKCSHLNWGIDSRQIDHH